MSRKLPNLIRALGVVLVLTLGSAYGWHLFVRVQHERKQQLNLTLLDAVEKNDTRAAIAALHDGADPNAKDTRPSKQKTFVYADQDRTKVPGEPKQPPMAANEPPLIVAAVNGNATVVRALLDSGALVNTRNHDGKTLLMWAAEQGSEPDVQALLDRGADVNATDKFKGTALLHAIENRKVAVVRILLDHGADPNTINFVKETPLLAAVHWSDTDMVTALLDKGASVNTTNELGWTPLFFAAYYGYSNVATLLLSRGADPNIRANDGSTALFWAHNRANAPMVACLKKAGAKS